ncbi:MAG TPA: anthranilate synthase component I [Candidatus Eisenbacteria bacterium]|nr:anthranilate synthase component I [Candidatus Eisenbacteria bacterium]
MISPTLEEFRALARASNLVPVTREVLADHDTPVSAFAKLNRGDAAFLLESLEGGETWGRYSILGFRPSMEFRSKGRVVEIRRGERTERTERDDPMEALGEILGSVRAAPVPGLPPFSGGAVGLVGYDYARFLERLPATLPDDLGHPDLHFVFPDVVLVFDNFRHRLRLVVNTRPEGNPDRAYREAVAVMDELLARLAQPAPGAAGSHAASAAAPAAEPPDLAFTSNMGADEYRKAVERAKEHIRAGDVVQVVLAHRLQATAAVAPFDVYRALRILNPSPYMFYLRFPDRAVAGSSPEILVRSSGGRLALRPIAGTRHRGATRAEDDALAKELLESEKDRAEHVMLVDLGRNDLGRIARVGSVNVTELMRVERYSHVMHLVSHVEAALRDGLGPLDVLRACFPAGTVSGAPKKRAMEIIESLEPARRGAYAGAMGYVDYHGNADFCITIRTATFDGGRIHLGVGAGIVADSDPEAEWQETRNKGRAVEEAVRLALRGLDA